MYTTLGIVVFYRIVCMATGLAFAYLGFRLYEKGILNSSAELEAKLSKDMGLLLKRGGPGLYFELFGTVVVGISMYKGVQQTSFRSETYRNVDSSIEAINEILMDLPARDSDAILNGYANAVIKHRTEALPTVRSPEPQVVTHSSGE